ncbi:hypothetical protein NDN08_004165 [Rhodosorus marinus]|uniref:Uncharacterized protein n=1 Tax=Rhodosorus marinus TaxID=101924 RepID=A0AAV8UK66_9RHOD|nr:hypothetical protein NDN08_004165 [Rhodosorus marinus]
MDVQTLPEDLWRIEAADPESFYEAAAQFVYRLPRHGNAGEGSGWWCSSPRVMRSMIMIIQQQDYRLNSFKEEISRQLGLCKRCTRSYIEEKAIWKSTAGRPEQVASAISRLNNADLRRFKLAWKYRGSKGDLHYKKAVNASLELLLDYNLCCSDEFLQAFEESFSNGPIIEAASAQLELADEHGVLPIGMLAVASSRYELARIWAREVLSSAPVQLESMDGFLSQVVFQLDEFRVAKDRSQHPPLERIASVSSPEFWDGLAFLFSQFKMEESLGHILTMQPRFVERLLFEAPLNGAVVGNIIKLLNQVLTTLEYKFWLIEAVGITPETMMSTVVSWYEKFHTLSWGFEILSSLVLPILKSLIAFETKTVREVYQSAMTLLSKISDPGGLFYGNMAEYASQASLGGKESVSARKLLVKVAASGYDCLKPDIPSCRVDWVRTLLSILRSEGESDAALGVFRRAVLLETVNSMSTFPRSLGGLSSEYLLGDDDPTFRSADESAERRLLSDSFLWDSIANLHHRGSLSGRSLVDEMRLFLLVMECVHFLNAKDLVTSTEEEIRARGRLNSIQESLSLYMTKVDQSLPISLRMRELGPQLRKVLAPHLGAVLFCSHNTLRQKSFLLVKTLFRKKDHDEDHTDVLKWLFEDENREAFLGSVGSAIRKSNLLPTSNSHLMIRAICHWIPLISSTAQHDADWMLAMRESLATEDMFSCIERILEELVEQKELSSFQLVAPKVIFGLRRMWELALFDPVKNEELHAILFKLLLRWGRLPTVQREWTNTVAELYETHGAGDSECFSEAQNLVMELGDGISVQQFALIEKIYAVQRVLPQTAERVGPKAGVAPSAASMHVSIVGRSGTGVGAADPRRPPTKIERMKLEMRQRIRDNRGSKMAMEGSYLENQNNAYEAGKIAFRRTFDNNVKPDAQAIAAEQKVKREKTRTLDDFRRQILQWSVSDLQNEELGLASKEVKRRESYPERFPKAAEYSMFWEPLLLGEIRAGLSKAYMELLQKKKNASASPTDDPFVRMSVVDPPETKDRSLLFSLTPASSLSETKSMLSGQEAEMPAVGDLVLLRIKKEQATWEGLALVLHTGNFRSGAATNFLVQMKKEGLIVFPGLKVEVAIIQGLATYQRQYEAIWHVSEARSRITSNILSPRERLGVHDIDSKFFSIPRSMQQMCRSLATGRVLNESQLDAVKTAVISTVCNSSSNGFTLLHGPPGTGKTTTVLSLLSVLLADSVGGSNHMFSERRKKMRVLVCAPSNAAVDEILVRVMRKGLTHPEAENGFYVPSLVRVGGGSTSEDVKKVSVSFLLSRQDGMDSRPDKDLTASRDRVRSELDHMQSQISEADKKRNDWRKSRKQSSTSEQGPQVNGEGQRESSEVVVDVESSAERDAWRITEANVTEKFLAQDERLTRELTRLHAEKNAVLKELREQNTQLQSQRERSAVNVRDAIDNIVSSATLVFTTLNSAGHDFLRRSSGVFDCVVLDEAAQAVEPEVLIPLTLVGPRKPPHCIMVGDPRQLPATVFSNVPAVRKVFSKSLFERLNDGALKKGSSELMLAVQYRMHPLISKFPSQEFYAGKLMDAENVRQKEYTKVFHTKCNNRFGPLTFVDTSGCGKEERSYNGSVKNRFEQSLCVSILKDLITKFRDEDFTDKIAILSPYKVQVRELHQTIGRDRLLSTMKIEVNTIDGIQGREKDIVLLSTVRSGSINDTSSIGFLKDLRRMNVAITRAKYSLITIGDAKLLQRSSPSWSRMIQFCEENSLLSQVDARGRWKSEQRTNSYHEAAAPLPNLSGKDEPAALRKISPEGADVRGAVNIEPGEHRLQLPGKHRKDSQSRPEAVVNSQNTAGNQRAGYARSGAYNKTLDENQGTRNERKGGQPLIGRLENPHDKSDVGSVHATKGHGNRHSEDQRPVQNRDEKNTEDGGGVLRTRDSEANHAKDSRLAGVSRNPRDSTRTKRGGQAESKGASETLEANPSSSLEGNPSQAYRAELESESDTASERLKQLDTVRREDQHSIPAGKSPDASGFFLSKTFADERGGQARQTQKAPMAEDITRAPSFARNDLSLEVDGAVGQRSPLVQDGQGPPPKRRQQGENLASGHSAHAGVRTTLSRAGPSLRMNRSPNGQAVTKAGSTTHNTHFPVGSAKPKKRKLEGELYPSSHGEIRGQVSSLHSEVRGNVPHNSPVVQGPGRDDPRLLRAFPQAGTVEFPAKVRRSVKPAVGMHLDQHNATGRMSRLENAPAVNRPGPARDSAQKLSDAARLLPGNSRHTSRSNLVAKTRAYPANRRIIGSSAQRGSSQPLPPPGIRRPDLRNNPTGKTNRPRRQGSIRSRIANRLDEMNKTQKR